MTNITISNKKLDCNTNYVIIKLPGIKAVFFSSVVGMGGCPGVAPN